MKKFLLFLFLLPLVLFAQSGPTGQSAPYYTTQVGGLDSGTGNLITFKVDANGVLSVNPIASTVLDPCQDKAVTKVSVQKAVNATSTLELVALASGQTIYPCGFLFTQTLAGTVAFVTGTGTNCATGQTNVSPAFGTVANNPFSYTPGMMAMTVPVSQALCATTTGLTAPAQVLLTYVQR